MSDFSQELNRKINQILLKKKEDLTIYVNSLKPSDIAKDITEFNPKKHRIIRGFCRFKDRPDIKDLGVLEIITGYADFSDSNVEKLGNLYMIGQKATFRNSKIKSLSKIETVGGDLELISNNYRGKDYRAEENDESEVEDLGELTLVGESLIINNKIKTLNKLRYIGGYVNFSDTNVESLGNLELVTNRVIFSNSKIKRLSNLKSVGDFIDFSESQVTDLDNLTNLGAVSGEFLDEDEKNDWSKYFKCDKGFVDLKTSKSSLSEEDVIEHLTKMNKNYVIDSRLTFVSNSNAFDSPHLERDTQNIKISYMRNGLVINNNGNFKFFNSLGVEGIIKKPY